MSRGIERRNIVADVRDDLTNAKAGEDRTFAYTFRSFDNGRTWDDFSLISPGFDEVSFLQTGGKRILATMQSVDHIEDLDGFPGWIHLTESFDNGKPWSEPCRVTFDREHPANLIQFPDGRIIMPHGNPGDDKPRWRQDLEPKGQASARVGITELGHWLPQFPATP